MPDRRHVSWAMHICVAATACLLLTGCTWRASSPSVPSTPSGVKPGQYEGPATVQLGNGATLTLAKDWVLQVDRTGAATRDPIIDGAQLAYAIDLTNTGSVSVFETPAAYTAALRSAQNGVESVGGGATATENGVSITQTATAIPPQRMSDEITVTAFVHSWSGGSMSRRTIVFMEERGRAPLMLDIWSHRLPAAFGAPTDAQLPLLWLRFFALIPK